MNIRIILVGASALLLFAGTAGAHAVSAAGSPTNSNSSSNSNSISGSVSGASAVASPTQNSSSTNTNDIANQQGQHQGQGQGQSQSASSNNHVNNTVAPNQTTSVTPTQDANLSLQTVNNTKEIHQAPGIIVSPANTTAPCVVAVGGGLSGPGFGFGLSGGVKDAGCEYRSRVELYGKINIDVARAYACDHDPDLLKVYERLGLNCYFITPKVVEVSAPAQVDRPIQPAPVTVPPPPPVSAERIIQQAPKPQAHLVPPHKRHHKRLDCACNPSLRPRLPAYGQLPAPKQGQ